MMVMGPAWPSRCGYRMWCEHDASSGEATLQQFQYGVPHHTCTVPDGQPAAAHAGLHAESPEMVEMEEVDEGATHSALKDFDLDGFVAAEAAGFTGCGSRRHWAHPAMPLHHQASTKLHQEA